MVGYFNGRIAVSKTADWGSSPYPPAFAVVVELVDTVALRVTEVKLVGVRVSPSALRERIRNETRVSVMELVYIISSNLIS